jgi:hypothetical protein
LDSCMLCAGSHTFLFNVQALQHTHTWMRVIMADMLCYVVLCFREEEAVLRLTEDATFKRRVMAETGTHTPTMIGEQPRGRRQVGMCVRYLPRAPCEILADK